MIPDLLQYFLDEFWNFQNSPNIDQVWTCGPRIYCQNIIKNTRTLWEHQAWVYGLRWRPVCCIFFLSDFLGFRHATAFSFLVFLDSGMSLHFIFCFVLRLFRFFRLSVSLRSFDSLILWLSFMLSIIQEGDGEVWRLCGCTWAPLQRIRPSYNTRGDRV